MIKSKRLAGMFVSKPALTGLISMAAGVALAAPVLVYAQQEGESIEWLTLGTLSLGPVPEVWGSCRCSRVRILGRWAPRHGSGGAASDFLRSVLRLRTAIRRRTRGVDWWL